MSGGTLPTGEETLAVKEILIISIILTIFERDSKLISGHLKTPGPYMDAIQQAMDLATAELTALRTVLRRKEIRVIAEDRNEQQISATYLCRGYENKINLPLISLKSEVDVRMRRYLGLSITEDLKEEAASKLRILSRYLLFPPPIKEGEWFKLIKDDK